MQYMYKIVDTARDDEVVGYIHTERDLMEFLADIPEETREKMDLIPAAVENEGKSETEAPRKNANDWYWEHKDDRNLAQPRKEKVYPKYINGMTEEDIQKIIKVEKKNEEDRDTVVMVVRFIFLAIYIWFMFGVWKPGMDKFVEASGVPMLIGLLVILVSTAIVLLGIIYVPVLLPELLVDKIMEAPCLRSGESIEDYVRQKYAYKVLTPEELEQTNMRMQPKQKEHTQKKDKKELKDQQKAKNRSNKMICKIQKWLDEEEK